MSLKVSVSGVRGIWGDSLTIEIMEQYTCAFAAYVIEKGGKTILLGRDGRPTGEVMARFVASVLNIMGLDVVDAGIVPTPTILFGVRECGYDAGIILSASHNPLEWNAFKLVKNGGIFTDDDDLKIIKKYLQMPLTMPTWDKIGTYHHDEQVSQKYIQTVLSAVDVALIKNANLKVLLDPVNCSGSIITKKLFKQLNINAFYIHDTPNGYFERPAEPIPAHLTHLRELISKYQVDIAFAQDPDADRLVVADEMGEVLSEELTGVLALKDLLDRGERGAIVLNMSTSCAGEQLNAQFNGNTVRSKVGEANVVKKITEIGAFYGIEGNGGVIYPKINMGRDSLIGIVLILEMLAREQKSISQIVKNLPQVVMKKEKYQFLGDLTILFEKMKKLFPNACSNDEDGLRLDLEDRSWIHLRASNTEPIIRLIAESYSHKKVQELLDKVNGLF